LTAEMSSIIKFRHSFSTTRDFCRK